MKQWFPNPEISLITKSISPRHLFCLLIAYLFFSHPFVEVNDADLWSSWLLDVMTIAVHFWAPTFKWVISIANVADFSKPPENISYPQQFGLHLPQSQVSLFGSMYSTYCSKSSNLDISAGWDIWVVAVCWFAVVACTGVIWSRYSLVIKPVRFYYSLNTLGEKLESFTWKHLLPSCLEGLHCIL